MSERSLRDDVHVAPALREEPLQTHEAATTERYVGGEPPAVANAAGAHDRTASQLAFEDDGNTRELKAKISRLVASQFGGDYKKAFAHYDSDGDGAISKGELGSLLSDAGVGNGMTRGAWVKGIIEKLDHSGDGKIGWQEFEAVVGTAAA
jgi:hypothetical protein